MPTRRPSSALLVALLVLTGCLGSGCNEEAGQNERRKVLQEDVPATKQIIRRDLNDGMSGVRQAAALVERGFLVDDAARQEREMRSVLRRLRQPRRGIPELLSTPVSFIAAVGMDGKVICRDADPDLMRGFDIAQAAPVVRRALDSGEAAHELSRLPSLEEDEPPSVTVIFAAPARHDGQVVGAIVAGLPLWRIAQQLSNQLQLDNAPALQRGELVWALLWEGDELHYHAGYPPDLRELVPNAEQRAAGLASSPGGYTGEVNQYGRWYGYGVLPLPTLGEDVGVVLFRSDPI
jgi:hypothetical protein